MAIVKLVVEKSEGPPDRHSIAIAAEETVVGRHRDCTLRIPSAEVSRRHCILHLKDDVLKIEDLGSLNGTYVNGDRITGTQELHPGDRLEIGPVIFAVEYEGVEVAAAVVQITAEIAAAESATVDMKPADTGLHSSPMPGEVVVTVEPVTEPAPSHAFTRLEK
jgi:pSer/pThr/pTyr-binding forkhead associated (FHA) protein